MASTASSAPAAVVGLPWVEKYRPRDLTDVVGNEPAMQRLRAMAEDRHMPNLLLSGPPGCGKTTSLSRVLFSVMCLARALLGDDLVKTAVLELNASDDRGIDVVRNRIKTFAQQKISMPAGGCQQKIVILDEADSMTEAAQQAMRRTMEIHSSTTRFALACNQSTKIIEPIQSRCAIVRFTRLKDSDISTQVKRVAEVEKVQLHDDGLEALIFTAEGDMRAALNNLQSTATGFGVVTKENVFKVCDQPQPGELKQATFDCVKNDWCRAFDRLNKITTQGYSIGDIVGTLERVIRNLAQPEELSEAMKIEFLKEIAMCRMRMSEGLQSRVQLSGLVAAVCAASDNLHQMQQRGA
ncbi:Subunit of heteropentameric Replication factor C (RF-C) [Perkinsus olseni]|uniref:Subunit of heteropentameric Replication factor C (RF-C) n=1 Tax=Perkinsus olseni TaxID=32597 RepID=A0A7J6LAP3_PEROL|nr:Subunit of heteropentameric Replication factor C (RF-C) [Perkinsus olseni]